LEKDDVEGSAFCRSPTAFGYTQSMSPMPFIARLAALCSLFAAAVSSAAPPLRVGMELSYPPFEMTDPQGRPAGVSVRLAEALGRHLGREVVIENIAFDGQRESRT